MEGGNYACGRVIGNWPENFKGCNVGFFAGLLNWVSTEPPTYESIANKTTIIQGGVHIKTIIKTGGTILGNRPIELDGIEPELFIEYPDNKAAYIYRGMEALRKATREEVKETPALGIFGIMYMENYANVHFNKNT